MSSDDNILAFRKADIDVMLESVLDWEDSGDREFQALSIVKNLILPEDTNSDQYRAIKALKDHYVQKEKEIKNSRSVRRERGCYIRFKLYKLLESNAVNHLFTVDESSQNETFSQEQESVSSPVYKSEHDNSEYNEIKKNLILAEHYIKDLGVWERYQSFLKEDNSSILSSKLD